MSNIYITGDTHRDYSSIAGFCECMQTTKDDLMIVLGDNGVNYYGNEDDLCLKAQLERLPITFMFIRGNHDMRPTEKIGYQTVWHDTDLWTGMFLVEPAFPSLLFAQDGHGYRLNGKIAFVIGGAYSVDKPFRLEYGLRWFPDEQLSKEDMWMIGHTLATWDKDVRPSVFLTHTCPLRYKPIDALLPGVDQSTVDESMERWLDNIESLAPYERWYCGHWHIDRTVDKLRFMYHDIILFE